MANKKNLIIVALVTFCLTVTLFSVIPKSSSQGGGNYNPWLDVNDDGWVDGSDLIQVARAWGTAGVAVNKTELLYNVSDTLASLLAKIDSLNATLIEQQNIINNLNNTVLELQNITNYLDTTVDYLNQTVIVLNDTKLGKPDYDSEWYPIAQGQQLIFNHNLGTTNVLVYMIGYDTSGILYIHQIKYGGDAALGNNYGCRWQELTSTTITIYRESNDPSWNYVRIMLWKIPTT